MILHAYSTNRQVGVIAKGFGIAIRVRLPPLDGKGPAATTPYMQRFMTDDMTALREAVSSQNGVGQAAMNRIEQTPLPQHEDLRFEKDGRGL